MSTSGSGKLFAMNNLAGKNAQGSGVNCVKPCPLKKSWFSVAIYRVAADGKETYEPDLTLWLKLPVLGAFKRLTNKVLKQVKITDLTPGGTGEVQQIQHDNSVYEAIGDMD